MGGGVEEGEEPAEAAVREVDEETSLIVQTEKLLYRIIYDNRNEEHFYLCRYLSGDIALRFDSIEARKMEQQENFYRPDWYRIADLSEMSVYPLEIRDRILKDRLNGFSDTPREIHLKIDQLRNE